MRSNYAVAILQFGAVTLSATITIAAPIGQFGGPRGTQPPLIERAQSSHCISWYRECIARQDQGGGPAPRCLMRAGCSPYARLRGRDQANHCSSWSRECRARGGPPWAFRRCVERAGC
jgi:hypothetical protein